MTDQSLNLFLADYASTTGVDLHDDDFKIKVNLAAGLADDDDSIQDVTVTGTSGVSKLKFEKWGHDKHEDDEVDIFRFDMSDFSQDLVIEFKDADKKGDKFNDKLIFEGLLADTQVSADKSFSYDFIGSDGETHTVTVKVEPPADDDNWFTDHVEQIRPLPGDIVDGTEGDDAMASRTYFVDHETHDIEGVNIHDYIFGYGGNDKIYSFTGDDTIDGGSGNDFMRGGIGNDDILGGEGNDVLDGESGADEMIGGTGNDIYYVDDAGDIVTEADGEGHDRLNLKVDYVALPDFFEDIWLATGSAARTAIGNSADNMVRGNEFNNTLTGLGGHDAIYGLEGNDTISGGEGNDRLEGGSGNDSVDGGIGNDRMTGGGGTDYLVGGEGNDAIRGGGQDDTLDGGNGMDTLCGGGGENLMIGGLGDDIYKVYSATDTLVELADEGHDVVHSVVSFTLADNIEDLRLRGTAAMGTGNELDNVIHGNGSDNTINGGGGNDNLKGYAGNDTIYGGEGVDDLRGGSGNDNISGADGADRIFGNSGNDILNGGLHADKLYGGTGDDTLEGGAGNDVLKGGGGSDKFVFADGDGRDRVSMFEVGSDLVEFVGLLASNLTLTIEGESKLRISYGDDFVILKGDGVDTLGTDDFFYV
jgi:Ca2+-binding RTX toxin-like protein